jgi:hypothetical protein
MKSLIASMHERNVMFRKTTQDIMGAYSETLDMFFTCVSEGKMTITWASIDFHPTNDKFVNMVGMAKHNAGEILTMENGDEIYIDETNIDNYIRAMRFVLPLDPIESGDLDALLMFMEEFGQLSSHMSEMEVEALLSDDTFLKETFSAFSDIDPEDIPPIKFNEFDLTDLSLDEAQLQQLRLLGAEGKT